ncbi:MAG: queuosine precursor transporter [Proteobacteria bacterium]|nr:queuosine precursor transporter [Pseudomonadota bacterium]
MTRNISNAISEDDYYKLSSKYLWFLTLAYSMTLAISNWFNARLVFIFHKTISPGALIFPLTFLVADIITEVYGYKYMRKAIWAALLFNIIFWGYGQLIIHLPSPAYSVDNAAFDKFLAVDGRVIAGSFIAYLISEPLNSFILAKIKVWMKGEYMGIRFVASTVLAAGLDTLFFTFIAFYKSLGIDNLLVLGFNIWVFKVAIEILGLPISIRLAKFIKKKEEVDMYDTHTQFNIFKLESKYQAGDNKYPPTQNSEGAL